MKSILIVVMLICGDIVNASDDLNKTNVFKYPEFFKYPCFTIKSEYYAGGYCRFKRQIKVPIRSNESKEKLSKSKIVEENLGNVFVEMKHLKGFQCKDNMENEFGEKLNCTFWLANEKRKELFCLQNACSYYNDLVAAKTPGVYPQPEIKKRMAKDCEMTKIAKSNDLFICKKTQKREGKTMTDLYFVENENYCSMAYCENDKRYQLKIPFEDNKVCFSRKLDLEKIIDKEAIQKNEGICLTAYKTYGRAGEENVDLSLMIQSNDTYCSCGEDVGPVSEQKILDTNPQ